MTQTEITILRVRKGTRNRLRSRALTKRESYDEIINRLMGDQQESLAEDLDVARQRLLKQGISRTLVNMLGIMDKIELDEEKAIIRSAIARRLMK